jgi:hypothetical protein
MVYFNVVLSTDGKHLFWGCKPSIYFEQTSASSRFTHKLYHFWGPHSIEDSHYGALGQYGLQQLWSVLYLSVPVCVSFSASILKNQKHSMMITAILNQAILPIFKRESPTFTDFVWPCNLKHHSCWHNDRLLLVYLYVGIALQEILSAVVQLNHRKLDRKCLGLQYTQCLWKQHHWSKIITAQPMICNVNNIHVCALMNNLIDNTNKCTSTKIQAGFCLCDFFLCSFAVTQLEYLPHFSNLCNNIWFNTIWHRQYIIIFGLTRCSLHDMWSLLSCVRG